MQDFDYIKTSNINEVIGLLSKTEKKSKILNGGTDLISQLTDNRAIVDLLIDIKSIPEVQEIKLDNTGLFIGSAVTCLSLTKNNDVIHSFQGLYDAFSLIGGVQIQGRATIGGNLCNSSPAADSIPALIAYNADCIIAGQNGTKNIPVESFCTGPGKNVLHKDEFLIGVKIPKTTGIIGASYERFIPRNEMDIAVVGVGSFISVNENTGKIEKVRIALGAVGPTPIFVKDAGIKMLDHSINDENLEELVEEASVIAQNSSRPITDMRGSALQRKHLVKVLTKRTLLRSIDRIKSSLRK